MKEMEAETPVACTEIAEAGLLERYVAGTLDAHAAQALEDHFVACPRCQNELRLAWAIRQELGKPDAAMVRPRSRRWVAVAGLALAAGIGAVMVLRPTARANEWKDLGAVSVPPIYLGVMTRGAQAPGDSLFDLAMNDYGSGRYSEAASGLQRALAAGADSAPAEFFRGSALLMQDRPVDAATAYARVIALGESPYLAEARLYRAKALLRQGRAEAAVTELRAAGAVEGAVSGWALALADSVESRRRR
jgi:tetratricopeptide (TPR) repeat protein